MHPGGSPGIGLANADDHLRRNSDAPGGPISPWRIHHDLDLVGSDEDDEGGEAVVWLLTGRIDLRGDAPEGALIELLSVGP